MPARDIDHVVVMTRDLESARAGWAQLGFTTTPRAVHPFGTANSLIQLQGNFVELLEIDDESRIRPTAGRFFGFADHNRGFLAAGGEGASMLVLASADRDADQADWSARGLRTYEPFDFERKARLPDGSETRVAFSLAFTGAPAVEGLGFFVCQQHTPEAFWKPDYQKHRNGARRIAAVTLASPEPDAARSFLEGFSGGTAGVAGGDGCYAVALGQDRIEVVPGTPAAIPALEIAVDDVEAAAALVPGAWRDGPAIVLPSEITNGVSVRLVPATPRRPG